MTMTDSTAVKIDRYLQGLIFVFFNLIVFLTPFIFTWFNQELFEFNKMIFVYALSIILAFLTLARLILHWPQRQKPFWHWQSSDFLILIFLLSQIISTIFSIHPRTSWFGYYTRFNGGLLSTLTYIALFYIAKNNLNKKHWPMLINSFLLSSLLVSFYAIPEHFGHSLSCLIVTQKFDVACWVQDVQNRVFATFGQPNWLAAFLVMAIPLALNQWWLTWLKVKKTTRHWWQIAYLSLVLLADTIALLFTKSRSGFLALLIALSIQFLLILLKQKQKKYWLARLLPISIILLSIVFIGDPFTLKISTLFKKPSTTLETSTDQVSPLLIQEGGSKSSDIRRVVWRGALKVWQRYPVFGSGVETFAYSYYLDRPASHNLLSEWDFLYNKAHNELLNYLATTGAFGLASYLALFIGLAWKIFQDWRHKNLKNQDIAIISSLLAMFISNFFGFSTVMSNVLFVILAAKLLAEDKNHSTESNTAQWSGWTSLAFGLSLSLAGFLSFANWRLWHADYLFTNGSNYLSKGDYQNGLTLIQKAIAASSKEALFYDELGSQYSELAVALAQDGQATSAAQLAQAAIQTNNKVMELNPVHLNFYKSRAKIFLRLAQLDQSFYVPAKEALLAAIKLSPTDAKLYYNLALVEEITGNLDQATDILQQTVALKANYWQAYAKLGEIAQKQGQLELALENYRHILENIDPNNQMAQQALLVIEASLSAQKP